MGASLECLKTVTLLQIYEFLKTYERIYQMAGRVDIGFLCRYIDLYYHILFAMYVLRVSESDLYVNEYHLPLTEENKKFLNKEIQEITFKYKKKKVIRKVKRIECSDCIVIILSPIIQLEVDLRDVNFIKRFL